MHEGIKGNVGGMLPIGPNMNGVPPHWLAYFAVVNCDESVKKVVELEGKVIVPATNIPNIAVLRSARIHEELLLLFSKQKPTHISVGRCSVCCQQQNADQGYV
ncbi:hypothetical protein [Pajaroellobacter abortibovis]|nr:hypothetical protein [Pajaroellobacter abortibovis]